MKNIFKHLYYLYYRPKIFFPKKTYSTYGEDIIIEQFFKNKKKGFMLILDVTTHLKATIPICYLKKDGMV